MPARPGRLDEQRDPPVDGHVVDLDAALGEQLGHVAIRQRVPQVPADGHRDHLRREPEPGEHRPPDDTPSSPTSTHPPSLPYPSTAPRRPSTQRTPTESGLRGYTSQRKAPAEQ